MKLSTIMIGAENAKALAQYYEKVLGKKPEWSEGEWCGWDMGGIFLSIGPHSEAKGQAKEPFRVMFNFETKDVKGEFERMKKAGAIVIKEPYGMTPEGEQTADESNGLIATLADPEGNYFQLVTPWESPEKTDELLVN